MHTPVVLWCWVGLWIASHSRLFINGPSEPSRLTDVCVCQWVKESKVMEIIELRPGLPTGPPFLPFKPSLLQYHTNCDRSEPYGWEFTAHPSYPSNNHYSNITQTVTGRTLWLGVHSPPFKPSLHQHHTVTWLHTWHEVLCWDTNLGVLMAWMLQCPTYLGRRSELYHLLLHMRKVKTAYAWDNTEHKRMLLWLTMIFLVHWGPWHVSSSYRVPSHPLAVCTLPFLCRNVSYPSRPSHESASSPYPTWSIKTFKNTQNYITYTETIQSYTKVHLR